MAFSARKFDAWLLPALAAIVTPVLVGILEAAGAPAGDGNLVDGNIKRGLTIFGVSRHSNVVDTAQAVAPETAADISAAMCPSMVQTQRSRGDQRSLATDTTGKLYVSAAAVLKPYNKHF